MSTAMRAVLVKTIGVLSAAGAMMLTGCGVGMIAGPTDTPGFKISGNVHGGPLPIQGATIRLMTTASNGTWQASTGSYKGTATTQLTTTSNNYGFFTFPETGWACPAGQYAYVTVTGGHTAAQTNNNVVQVGVIGSCSDKLANQGQYDSVNVFVSELSTIAAGYALRDFITIDSSGAAGQQIVNIAAPANNNKIDSAAGCSGTGDNMVCTHAGLAHAFLNAYNLVDSVTYDANAFPSGTARATIPGNSQTYVPQAEINTIGNIMQVCVDSGGSTVGNYNNYTVGTSRCGDLFYYTTPPGSTTSPTNTLQVVLNMAQYPTNNVDKLFTLQPQVKFFVPAMTSDTLSGDNTKLMAYTLSIFYTGTGLTGDNGMAYPTDVALDEKDNVFVSYRDANQTYAAVKEWSSNGTGLLNGPQLATITNPASIALDSLGNLFLTNDSNTNGSLFQIRTTNAGGFVPGSLNQQINVTNNYAAGVAVDRYNNVWVSRDAASKQTLFRYSLGQNNTYSSVNFNTNPAVGGAVKHIFISDNQNILGVTSSTDTNNANPTTTASVAFTLPYGPPGGNNAGATLYKTTLTSSNGYATGKLIGGTGNVVMPVSQQVDTWTPNNQGNGLVTNGGGKYAPTGAAWTTPLGLAVDGAGAMFWPDFVSAGQVYWFQPSSFSDVSNGTLTSFFPCYPTSGQCYSQVSSYLRGMAADSSGAIWYTADSSAGVLVQTFGLAAPTYPLLAYAQGSVIIQ